MEGRGNGPSAKRGICVRTALVLVCDSEDFSGEWLRHSIFTERLDLVSGNHRCQKCLFRCRNAMAAIRYQPLGISADAFVRPLALGERSIRGGYRRFRAGGPDRELLVPYVWWRIALSIRQASGG